MKYITYTKEEKWHDDDDVARYYTEWDDDTKPEEEEPQPPSNNAATDQESESQPQSGDSEEAAEEEEEDEESRRALENVYGMDTRAARELRRLTCSFNPEAEQRLNDGEASQQQSEASQVTTRSQATQSVPPDNQTESSNPEISDLALVVRNLHSERRSEQGRYCHRQSTAQKSISCNQSSSRGSGSGSEDLLLASMRMSLMSTNSSDKPTPEEPTKFEQAWNHPDPNQRTKWREAIQKEFNDMNKRKVWDVIPRQQMPSDRRCVKSKWVFKIKRDGRYRARLVACGYSQIPGVDFAEEYAPVIDDITFKMLIALIMKHGYSAKIVDVETAFLYGELEEEIFMECPPGMQGVTRNNILLLRQCIYGLVQAARQYFKRIKKTLHSIGFKGDDADKCLFCRRCKKGICYIAVYVDDNLMVGDIDAIDDTIKSLEKHGYILKIQEDLKDYLSCQILFSNNATQAWVCQPHLVSTIKSEFGEEVESVRNCLTPGTPGKMLTKEKDDTLILSPEKHSRYRTGVGKLLYLVKYSRPDIANCVRELSKCLDGPTETSYKELLRAIKYVLNTNDKGLKMHQMSGASRDIVTINCYTDSDYAGDPDTRRSVSGHVMYLDGSPISWRSKSQSTVTLSSTEAEWIALCDAVKEVMFLFNVLADMEINVELPVQVHVDNQGAVHMSKNNSTTSRTKHIDVRYKYIRELIDDGMIEVTFVPTRDNDADLFTKNLPSELFQLHADKLTKNKPQTKESQGK
jgi:hypothetical protein